LFAIQFAKVSIQLRISDKSARAFSSQLAAREEDHGYIAQHRERTLNKLFLISYCEKGDFRILRGEEL
jgi:hypothetical protein